MRHCYLFFALMSAVFALSPVTLAQDEAPALDKKTSAVEVLEEEQKVKSMIAGKDRALTPENARTPLELVLGLAKYMGEEDYETAGRYLDMRYLTEPAASYSAAQLVRALAFVWNQQNYIELTSVSDLPEGTQNDGLPSYRDQAGEIQLREGAATVFLQRVPAEDGGRVWKVSNATVAMIPQMWEEHGYSEFAIWLSNKVPRFVFLGMQSWQLLLFLAALILQWFISGWITQGLLWLTLKTPYQFPDGIRRFWLTPMRLIAYVLLFRLTVQQLGLSVTAKVYLKSSPLEYIAVTVLITGIITLWRDFKIRKLERAGELHFVALLRPMVLIIKILVVTAAVLTWAFNAGFNISTLIAGLGVGSLAVALAAQKTLENVIGAATLYAARPIRPGDFCRFGSVKGTVEEIGLRSVRLRTLNRTIVSVPNAMFASGEVENISARDRIRFFRELQLQMPTSEQLQVILGEFRELLYAHPKVQQDTISVRLEKIEAAIAIIRMDAGVMTCDFQEYLAVAEELNLRIIEIVHGNGTVFSGPGQVLQLREFHQANEGVIDAVNGKLQKWHENDSFPFPDVSTARKAELKGSFPSTELFPE